MSQLESQVAKFIKPIEEYATSSPEFSCATGGKVTLEGLKVWTLRDDAHHRLVKMNISPGSLPALVTDLSQPDLSAALKGIPGILDISLISPDATNEVVYS